MPNFFEDNEDIQFQLDRMDLSEIVRLVEDDYTQAQDDPTAAVDYEDAKDNYRRALALVGEIAGDFIDPRAEQVDLDGPTLNDGVVTYAKGIAESLEVLSGADLMGFTLPRKYGGLNMPNTIYMLAIEMVSRADAALMNIFGLQEIAETIHSFADDDLKDKYLPGLASGEATGAMVLTEPDAGSDLQAVHLKATPTDDPKVWKLNGVKRFITNGCGDVLLVLARSEEGTEDGRGLSLFLCDGDPKYVYVRRIENKLGIHGSPTCELVFRNATGYLVGQRRRGLIRYVMALMNGARLGIAAQSVGIAEAAYREGLAFARERQQFGSAIFDFPAVYDMLTTMKIRVLAARTLMCAAGESADMERLLTRRMEKKIEGDDPKELKAQQAQWSKLAAMLTPMAKYYASEIANSVCYDSIQIHGGSGFMKDYPVERHYRDARITSIYEGPSQLQVIAAIGGVMSGLAEKAFEEFAARDYPGPLADLAGMLKGVTEELAKAVAFAKEKGDKAYTEYHARRLVDVAMETYIGYLFLDEAKDGVNHRDMIARKWITDLVARANMLCEITMAGDTTITENYNVLLSEKTD